MVVRDPERLQQELWAYELSRGTLSPLPFRQGFVSKLAWTPDGKSLVLSALIGTSGYHIYQLDADGQGEPRLMIEPGPNEGFHPVSWLPDGSLLAMERYGADRTEDIWLLPVEEGAEPVKFLTGPSSEQDAVFSPGGATVPWSG